jgi:hypothetical protein
MRYHIVYKTTNKTNGKFYIGVHSTDNLNDKYLGSGKYLLDAIGHYGKDAFVRETLSVHSSLEECLNEERKIVTHAEVENPMCYNLMLGGGMPPVMKGKDHVLYGTTREDSRTRMLSDANPSRGKFGANSASYNTVIVYDQTIDKTIRISKNDPRYLNGELVCINKGKVTVKDNEGNFFHVEQNDPRYLSGELIHSTKGYSFTCPHCNKTGGITMKRWHFDNCKFRKEGL